MAMGHKNSFLPAVSDLLLRHIRVFPSFFGFCPRFRNGHLSFLLVFFLFHFLPFLVRHHLQRRTTNRAHVRVLRGLKISNIEKKALVLILLVLVFTHNIKIKKKHVRNTFNSQSDPSLSVHILAGTGTQRVPPTCINNNSISRTPRRST